MLGNSGIKQLEGKTMMKRNVIASIAVLSALVSCSGASQGCSSETYVVSAPEVPSVVVDAGKDIGDAACSDVACGLPPVSLPTEQKQSVEKNDGVCPNGMLEVDGNYCDRTDAQCLYWVDNHGRRTNINTDRCGEFKKPVHCIGHKRHLRFCEDRFEFPNKEGAIPQDWMSWYDAKNACEAIGKRLCTKSEWMLGAGGNELSHPIPYGDGFHRDPSLCNIDRHIADVGLTGDDVMKVKDPNSEVAQKLRSQLVPSGSMNCVSPYGIQDTAGGVDEWVLNETGRPYVSSLVGGHSWGVRNAANNYSTDAHSPGFIWYECSTRCCLSIEDNK